MALLLVACVEFYENLISKKFFRIKEIANQSTTLHHDLKMPDMTHSAFWFSNYQ
jgi:hypothetical protein